MKKLLNKIMFKLGYNPIPKMKPFTWIHIGEKNSDLELKTINVELHFKHEDYNTILKQIEYIISTKGDNNLIQQLDYGGKELEQFIQKVRSQKIASICAVILHHNTMPITNPKGVLLEFQDADRYATKQTL
jgi:hypothetical protein